MRGEVVVTQATELRFKDTIGDGVEVDSGDKAKVIIEKRDRVVLSHDGAREVGSDSEVRGRENGEEVSFGDVESREWYLSVGMDIGIRDGRKKRVRVKRDDRRERR